ncbi:MAG TPA: hypothetical protein VNV86_19135 [Candidatus Acidoferrum sp.]|nr:hypothetical protein [Candidatus Acidoferrum sp.]
MTAARGVDAAIVLSTAAIPEAFRTLRNGRPILVGLSTSNYEFPLTDAAPVSTPCWRSPYRALSTRMCVCTPSKRDAGVAGQLRRGELAGRAVIEFC